MIAVQFKDRSSVSLAIGLDGIECQGRKLRVQKCIESGKKEGSGGKQETRKPFEGQRAATIMDKKRTLKKTASGKGKAKKPFAGKPATNKVAGKSFAGKPANKAAGKGSGFDKKFKPSTKTDSKSKKPRATK